MLDTGSPVDVVDKWGAVAPPESPGVSRAGFPVRSSGPKPVETNPDASSLSEPGGRRLNTSVISLLQQVDHAERRPHSSGTPEAQFRCAEAVN
jgi:hypothetical protein